MTEQRNWASDDQYTDETYDTVDVQLSNGQWLRVRQKPPMQFATLAEKYGMDDIREAVEDADADDEEDITFEDTDVEGVGDVVSFFREQITPAVVRPPNAHWGDPPEDPEATGVFDLSSLSDEDLKTVIDAVVEDDSEEEKVDETGDYQGQFRGEHGGSGDRLDGRTVRQTANRSGQNQTR